MRTRPSERSAEVDRRPTAANLETRRGLSTVVARSKNLSPGSQTHGAAAGRRRDLETERLRRRRSSALQGRCYQGTAFASAVAGVGSAQNQIRNHSEGERVVR